MSYVDEVKADAPAGFWMLDDADGIARDSSGNGRNGTITGADIVTAGLPPTFGRARDFVAANLDQVEIPDNAAWDATTLSTEYWFKGTAPGSNVIQRDNVPDSFANRAFNVGHNATQFYARLFGAGAVSNSYVVPIPAEINVEDGEWHHFVHTLNSGGTMDCYLDGGLLGSVSISATSLNSSPYPIMFMSTLNDATAPYTVYSGHRSGSLAAVAFYPGTKLAADRVAAHYRVGASLWSTSGRSPMVMG